MRVLHKDLFELFRLFLFSVHVKVAEKVGTVQTVWKLKIQQFKELSSVLCKNASSLKSF